MTELNLTTYWQEVKPRPYLDYRPRCSVPNQHKCQESNDSRKPLATFMSSPRPLIQAGVLVAQPECFCHKGLFLFLHSVHHSTNARWEQIPFQVAWNRTSILSVPNSSLSSNDSASGKGQIFSSPIQWFMVYLALYLFFKKKLSISWACFLTVGQGDDLIGINDRKSYIQLQDTFFLNSCDWVKGPSVPDHQSFPCG